MKLNLNLRIVTLLWLPLALLVACGKQEPSVKQEKKQVAQEVYIYAYPLVLMDVSKRVMAAKAPVNTFHHMRAFPDHTFTDVVSPNADTLYSSVWLDLAKEPIVLSLPAMGKRYYLMPMLDAWTNVFASPGTRTTGNGKGDYAITGPNWKGDLPKGVTNIKSPTEMVWMIGRTQTNGKADYAAVRKVQDQYRLTALSAFGTPSAKTKTPAAAPAPGADTKSAPVDQVAAMSAESFFSRFASLLPGNPPLKDDGPMIEKMKKLGIVPGQPLDLKKLDAASANGVKEGAKAALEGIVAAARKGGGGLKNGWTIHLDIGTYGTEYPKRALIAWVGLGANIPEDAVYPLTRVDADGKPLNGANRYVLHFDKGQTPPVNGFWSLTMYNDKQFFVENPIGRYAIGDRDTLKLNKDGSLDIHIQHESPGKDKESNWLPAPKDGFNLVMRMYWPKKPVLDGTWVPPAIKRVN